MGEEVVKQQEQAPLREPEGGGGQERKRRPWKRFLLLAILPALAHACLQVLVGIGIMVKLSVDIALAHGQGQGPELGAHALDAAYQAAVPTAVFWLHLLSIPVFGLWLRSAAKKWQFYPPGIRRKPWAAILPLGLGMSLLAHGMVMAGAVFAPKMYDDYVKMMESAGFGQSAISIIAAVLLAPIGEEIVCRGLTLHYGRMFFIPFWGERGGFWAANVLQALVFGLIHGDVLQGVYAFVLGMVLGLVAQYMGGLGPAIFAHFLVNGLSVFVFSIWFVDLPDSPANMAILLALGALLLWAGFWPIRRVRAEGWEQA